MAAITGGIADKTRIGIVPRYNPYMQNYEHPETFPKAIFSIGAAPIMIPFAESDDDVIPYLDILDGLVTIGGWDLDPSSYTDDPPSPANSAHSLTYDRFEFRVQKLAYARNLPTLAVCRGIQVMNVAFGGTMYQDLPTQRRQATYNHAQGQPWDEPQHDVTILPGTRLAAAVGSGKRRVNSMHHQSLLDVAPGFEVNALAGDGVIEGIEAQGKRFFVGVQWHPEEMNGLLSLTSMLEAMLRVAGVGGSKERG